MDILKYRDYEGSANINLDRLVCRGKILLIDDLVTFEASSSAKLQSEFADSIANNKKINLAINKNPI
jgi:predicted HicB family RNase H-like nuclease